MTTTAETDDALERERLLEAFAEHLLMRQTIDYVRRGRRFARVTTPALLDIWVELYTLLAERFDELPLPLLQQVEAELSLRGVERPMERVKAAEWVFKEKLAARAAQIDADPALFAECVSRIKDDYVAFRRSRSEGPAALN
jgi:hypothetical protein